MGSSDSKPETASTPKPEETKPAATEEAAAEATPAAETAPEGEYRVTLNSVNSVRYDYSDEFLMGRNY